MKLVDLVVRRSFLGDKLKEGMWYIRVEMRDILKHLKDQYTLQDFNKRLVEAETTYMECFEKVKAVVPENLKLDVEPVVWQNAGVNVSTRGVLQGASEEEMKAVFEDMKQRLLKADVYLRIDVSLR